MIRAGEDMPMTQQLASELREAVLSGERVDQELIDLADNVLDAHQVYTQLLFVGMVVDRITQLTHYFDALDATVEILDTEDLAEASTGEKIRAISALNQAIKTKIEVIGSMMASKDAVGMLSANMKDTFGGAEELVPDGAQEALLGRLQNLPAEQRQRILGVAVTAIRDALASGEHS